MSTVTEAALVELLGALVGCPTPNPPGEEAPLADVIEEHLAASPVSFECERVVAESGRPNLVARAGDPDRGRFLLAGHMDTVPATADEWTGDPYELRRVDDRLVGRGTADMKGGLAAKLVAAESFLAAHEAPGEVVLAFTVDEERGGEVGTGAIAEAGVTADGAIIGEPTDCRPAIAQYGALGYELTVHGESAHSGRPDRGRNAIDGLRRALDGVAAFAEEIATENHPILEPGPSLSITGIEGGIAPNVIPDRATATLVWRTLPGAPDPTACDADLRAAIEAALTDGDEYDLERWLTVVPAEIPTDHPVVGWVRAAARAQGLDDEPVGFNAGSDARFLVETGTPTLLFGPGTIEDDAHTVDESIPVDALVTTARVYEGVLERALLG